MTLQTLNNLFILLIFLSLAVLFYKAFKNLLLLRRQPLPKPDNNIYGFTGSDDLIEAKFLWRKNDRLVFEKDKQVFAVGVGGDKLQTNFRKGEKYKLKMESNGSITILK